MPTQPVTEQKNPQNENRLSRWVKEKIEARGLQKRLTKLRNDVIETTQHLHEQRLHDNHEMTEEEKRLGVYLEDLDPQVRDAVREFNRKGYSTDTSGFYGEGSDIQLIEGHFRLDEETKDKLKRMGVNVSETQSWKYKVEKHQGMVDENTPEEAKHFTTVQFRPKKADLLVIKNQWDQIAALLPDRGAPATNWYRSQKG